MTVPRKVVHYAVEAGQLCRDGLVLSARIVRKEFEDSGDGSKIRIGTVLFPICDCVGAYSNQYGHVLLEQASLQPSSPNVVT